MLQNIRKPNHINVVKNKDQPQQSKILVIGDAGVGKTSILDRHLSGTFDNKYNPTIAVDFKLQKEPNTNLNYWDFSGHPEFVEVRNEFYREATLLLLVLDITVKRSLDGLDMWLREASDYGAGQVPVIVAANKVDLSHKRAITENELSNWCRSRQYTYFECSAQNGQNIGEIFKEIKNQITRG